MADNCPTCGQPMPLLSPSDKKPTRAQITFDQWVASREEGKPLIHPHGSAFRYADSVKLPIEYVELAWFWFQHQYRGSKKKYRDWPLAFLNSLKGCWCGYWRMNRDDEYFLTTQGKQAEMERRAKR